MTGPVPVARVLVAMDFDEASAAALHIAAQLTRAWQAELTVLHAEREDVPAYFTAKQIDELEREQQQRRAAVADELRAFATPHAAAANVVIVNSPPQDAILRMAPRFDLIAMGTHQRHGARRWWLGSVAESVMRRSPRPVLIVPANAFIPSGARSSSILIAGDANASVIKWADTLRTAIGGNVEQVASMDDCTPDRLRATDLIVYALPAAADHAHVKAISRLLQDCRHPVLFVPYLGETVERSSS